MNEEVSKSTVPLTPPHAMHAPEERQIGNVRVLLTPTSSGSPAAAQEPSQDQEISSNGKGSPTPSSDAEDQDLSHLLSDYDDILNVQTISQDNIDATPSASFESRNGNDMKEEDDDHSGHPFTGPQPSITSVHSAPSNEDGIRKSLSWRKHPRLPLEMQHTPLPTMTTEASTTSSSPPECLSTTPSSPAALLEKENLLRELEEVRMDRDFLEQQLLETRSELDTARTSLQKNIHDLEHELRTMRETKERLNESRENEALEMELFELAQMAREQEEKELSAKKKAEQRALQQSKLSPNNKSEAVRKDPTTKSKLTPNTGGGNDSSTDRNVVGGHSSKFYQDKIDSLEEKLSKRKFREQLLEKEIRDLRQQAQVEAKKFQETQRQVAWLQEELLAMDEKQGDDGAIIEGRAGSGELGIIPENEDVASDVNTVVTLQEGTRRLDEIQTDSYKESKRIRLLHQHRLELEQRVKDLLDEVGTLKVELGQLQHENRQQDTVIKQLRRDIKEQKQQHRMDDTLLRRQLKEWAGRAETLQQQLKREKNHTQELRNAQHRDRVQWRRQVEDLEKQIMDCEDQMEKERKNLSKERQFHREAVRRLETRLNDNLGVSATSPFSENHGSDGARKDGNAQGSSSSPGVTASTPLSNANDDQEIRILKRRIHQMESSLRLSRESETKLRNELSDGEKQAAASREEINVLTDRVQILQAFLDSSLDSSPSSQKGLREEYEAYKESNPLLTFTHDRATKARAGDLDVWSPDATSPEAQDFYLHIQKESRKLSLKSRSRVLKMKELDDVSENTSVASCSGASLSSVPKSELLPPAAVQDIQLKLDFEMKQLKERKEKLRRSSLSSHDSSRNRRFRSLLTPSRNNEEDLGHPDEFQTETPRRLFLDTRELSQALDPSPSLSERSRSLTRSLPIDSSAGSHDQRTVLQSEFERVRNLLQIAINEKNEISSKLQMMELEKDALDTVLAETETKAAALLEVEERYRKTEEERNIERQDLQRRIEILERENDEWKTSLLGYKSQAESLQLDLASLSNHLEEIKSSESLLINDRETMLASRNILQQEKDELERKLANMESELVAIQDSHEKNVENIRNDIASYQERTQCLENEVSTANNSLAEADALKQSLESELAAALAQVAGLVLANAALREERDSLLSDRSNLEKTKNDMVTNNQNLESMVTSVTEIKNLIQMELEESNRALYKEKQERARLQEKQLLLESQTQTDGTHISELKQQIEDLKLMHEKVVLALESSIDEKDSRILHLESQMASLSESCREKDERKALLHAQIEEAKRLLGDTDAQLKMIASTSNEQLVIMQRRVGDLEGEVAALKAELSSVSAQKLRVESELQQTKDCLNIKSKDVEELQKEIDRLKASEEDLESHIGQKDMKIHDMEKDLAQSVEALKNLKIVLKSKEAEITSLDERHRSHVEGASRAKALEAAALERENEVAMASARIEQLTKAVAEKQTALTLQEENAGLQETRLREMSVRLSALEAEIVQRMAEVKSARSESEKLSDEMNQKIQTKSTEISELTSQLALQENRLTEASGQLTEMEKLLAERTAEVQVLESKMTELEKKDLEKTILLEKQEERLEQASEALTELERKDLEKAILLEKREERLVQASEALTEAEETLRDKQQQIETQEERLLQASAALSEMERHLQDKNQLIETQEEKLLLANSELSEMTEKMSNKEAEMDEKINQRDARLMEASSQLSEMEDLLRIRSSEVQDGELKVKALESVVEKLQEELTTLKNEVEAERVEKRRLSVDLDEVQLDLSQKRTHLDRQLKTVAKLTNQSDMWQLELDDLEDTNKALVSKLVVAEQEKASLQENINALEIGRMDDVACLEKEKSEIERSLAMMQQERDDLQDKLNAASEVEQSLATLQQERDDLMNKLNAATNESSAPLAEMEEQPRHASKEIAATADLKSLQVRYDEHLEQHEVLRTEFESSRQGIKAQEDAQRNAIDELEKRHQTRLKELENQLQDLRNRDEVLQEEIANIKALGDSERSALSRKVECHEMELENAKALAEKRLAELEDSTSQFLREKELLAIEVERTKEVLKSHKLKAGALERTIHLLQSDNTSLTQNLLSTTLELEKVRKELASSNAHADSLRARETEVSTLLEELHMVKLQAEEEKTSLLKQVQGLIAEKSSISSKCMFLEGRETEFEELQAKYEELQKEIDALAGATKEEGNLLGLKLDATSEALKAASLELQQYKMTCQSRECKSAELREENATLRNENAAANKFKMDLQTKMAVIESERDAATVSLNRGMEEFERKSATLKAEKDELKSTLQALQSQINELEDTANSRLEALTERQKERDDLSSTLQAIRDENTRLMKAIEDVKAQAATTKEELELICKNLKESIEQHTAVARARLEQIWGLEKEKESLSQEIQVLQNVNIKLAEEVQSTNLQAGEISRELQALLDEHKSTVDTQQDELSELRVQREILLANVGSLEEKVGVLEEKLNGLMKENEALVDEIGTAKSQALEVEAEGEKLSLELTEFSKEYQSLASTREQEIVRLKEERDRLVHQVQQLQDDFEELQQMTEDEEGNHKELLASFQRDREELKRERDDCKTISESLRGEIKALKMETKLLEESVSHRETKIASLTSELETLYQKEAFRRELLSDMSTELSLTASRESKLQLEVQELKERSIEEDITTQSLESRERSISFEIDDLQRELEEAAVREAMLQCEIAEARGERDGLKQQRTQEELLQIESVDIASLLPPSDELTQDEQTNKDVATDAASAPCPIQ